jgi:hypothetical protein
VLCDVLFFKTSSGIICIVFSLEYCILRPVFCVLVYENKCLLVTQFQVFWDVMPCHLACIC